jgi:hypothetical protein
VTADESTGHQATRHSRDMNDTRQCKKEDTLTDLPINQARRQNYAPPALNTRMKNFLTLTSDHLL